MDFIDLLQAQELPIVGWLINLLMVVVGFAIKRELHHIASSIRAVHECAIEAKGMASRAHERIDLLVVKPRPRAS